MKKVLICGSSGFIGKNLLNYFSKSKKYSIFAQYNTTKPDFIKDVKFVKADLTNESSVKNLLKDIDIVFQAAATTSGVHDIVNQPYIHVTDNAIMNSYIMKYSYLYNVEKFIFFSCSVMYPNLSRKVNEKDFDKNSNIKKEYFGVGWTKVYIEKMCKFYSNLGETKFLVIRHSNIFGPFDKFDLKKSHVIGATIAKVLNLNSKEIIVWGRGSEKRDFLHIDDLISFINLFLKKKKYKKFDIVNVGSGKLFSIKSLTELIIQSSKRKLKIIYDKSKPSINSNICLSIKKAEQDYGWSPNIEFSVGIKNTISWYKKFLDINKTK